MRMLVVLPTLGIQLLSLVIIVRSPAFKSSRLNQFYFVTMLMYMAEAVLLGVFINRFANLGVVSQSFFVIVHTVMLSERYSSAITKNEMLIKFGKTKYHFLQDMNHEFRTPLSVIAASIAYTRIQIDEGGDLKPARDILKTAEAETLRVGRMLDGMVELARMDELGVNRERTDFAELLARCVGRLKRVTERQNTGITLNTAPGMPDVFVERDKLSQAVVCLLTNTLSHTPDGHITITTDFDSSVITTRVSGGEISEEGLLVCRTVLDAHGGTLELMPETGIVFTVPVYGGQEAGHG